MNIVILYEELADYFVKCINYVALNNVDVTFHVFRKQVNKEAPFQFNNISAQVYEREKYSEQELLAAIEKLDPSAIFCSGWIHKPYLRVCRAYKKRIPVTVFFDNKWDNSLRQNIAKILSPVFIHRYFNTCWVPGMSQQKFAKKLKFKEAQIHTGLYCCDTDNFHSIYKRTKETKKLKFPKRIIYLGRYVKHKGVELLWDVFSELVQSGKAKNWELWCLGTGEVLPQKGEAISHFGFIQPEQIGAYMKETGVYILPSEFEPWGVSVHEFACAGFPLLCSTEVGAAELFLKDGENGFSFAPGQKEELKQAILKIISLQDFELMDMSERSYMLSNQVTLQSWESTFLEIMNKAI